VHKGIKEFKKRFPKYTAIKAKVQKMPFKDNSIDKIETREVLSAPTYQKALKMKNFIPPKGEARKKVKKILKENLWDGSKIDALREIHRILKPGGKLILRLATIEEASTFFKIAAKAEEMGFKAMGGESNWRMPYEKGRQIIKITLVKQ